MSMKELVEEVDELSVFAARGGFNNERELCKMTEKLRLDDDTTGTRKWLYDEWAERDGTKIGLIHRFPELAPAPPMPTLALIHSTIKEIQQATSFMVKVEFSINLEGLGVMFKLTRMADGKVYGIDAVIPVAAMVDGKGDARIIDIKNKIFGAIQEAEKNAAREKQGADGAGESGHKEG